MVIFCVLLLDGGMFAVGSGSRKSLADRIYFRVGKNIADNPSLILEAGGVGTLSYEHHSLDEPAILLGGAFMSDIVENVEEPKKS
jgi:hypothetical protein